MRYTFTKMAVKCGRCSASLNDFEIFRAPRCSNCYSSFHFNCTTITEKSWSSYKKDGRCDNWKCQKCRLEKKNDLPLIKISSGPPVEDAVPDGAHTNSTLNEASFQGTENRMTLVKCDCESCPLSHHIESLLDKIEHFSELVLSLDKKLIEMNCNQIAMKKTIDDIAMHQHTASKHLHTASLSTTGYRDKLVTSLSRDGATTASQNLSHKNKPSAPLVAVAQTKNRVMNSTKRIEASSASQNVDSLDSQDHQVDTDSESLDDFHPQRHQLRNARKQFRKLNEGTAATSASSPALRTVKKPPRRKAVFVTRFDVSVSSSTIFEHCKAQLRDCHESGLLIAKLKTRRSTYNSFYVSIYEQFFSLINDAAFWPAGVFFDEFRGRLFRDRLFEGEDNFPLAVARETGTGVLVPSYSSAPSHASAGASRIG